MKIKNTKLLLFDIDGTLIRSGGKGKNAMLAAVREMFGGKAPLKVNFKDFAGSTDPVIIRTILEKNGLSTDHFEQTLSPLLESYLHFLEQELSVPNPVTILPGIQNLLNQLSNDNQFICALVTGNIEAGARLKLGAANLNHYFDFGAFGNDKADRNLLPPIAAARAFEKHDIRFLQKDIWVIGDTPRDVLCAKANGYRSMAVETGGWPDTELRTANPDVILPDLSDVETVLSHFLDG